MERIIGGFETRKDANLVVRMCKEIVRDYGELTLADVKDFVGISPAFEDRNIRWSSDDLENAHLYVERDDFRNYVIVLLTDEEWFERVAKSNAFCIYI